MRLVCLECSAAYEAPDSLFGAQPREVRCNRCGYQWTVVASPPESKAAAPGPSLRPAEAPAPVASAPNDLPRPRPVAAPPPRPEPVLAPAPPPPPLAPAPPAPALQRSERLADSIAGRPAPEGTLSPAEVSRPTLLVEPTAESTRTLLTGAPMVETGFAGPDPEERRLSHELDFGAPERHRGTGNGGGGTRRAVVIIILLIILAGIAAVLFEAQITAAVPALKSIYAQIGL